MRRPRRAVMLLVSGILLIMSLSVSPKLSPRQGWLPMGESRVSWSFAHGWGRKSWSGRQVEWDEPPPGEPVPQVYQFRCTQIGPLFVLTRRRVPPRPGEITYSWSQ